METIDIDERRWPLVVIRYPSVISEDDLRKTLARQSEIILRATPFAMLIDMSAGATLQAVQRKAVADSLQPLKDVMMQNMVGLAVVVASVLTRGAITAVGWVQPPGFPFKVFGALPDAEQWIAQRLAAHNLSVPARVPGGGA